ncbi:type II toxin-antitoxin system CcdA family antitoxin [Wenxinia saemankumensis]|uniref:Antitoxin CcdA n=1 Tax=Wenxinia saemankumensis TaxID=1447782 RepID=A0A1M6I1J2_9RHOB|nr:type II toxin-antitoxin system CcdA family antitoxin [Wenxinia saemankumensis]SHJ28317.1 antitoxin CcdA [Wenxinia saemankumensis]
MPRIKVSLTLDTDVAATARSQGPDMSRLSEAAIVAAARTERNRLWRAENRSSIDAYCDEIAREGLPLTAYRSF